MVPEDMYVMSGSGAVLSAPSPKPYPHKPPKCSDCAPLFMKVTLLRFLCSTKFWKEIHEKSLLKLALATLEETLKLGAFSRLFEKFSNELTDHADTCIIAC